MTHHLKEHSPTPSLILTNRYSTDSQRLWKAAIARGWSVHRISGIRIPNDLRSLPRPVIYAEALVGPLLAEELGVELQDPPLEWLPDLPEPYRKRSIHLSTLGEARTSVIPKFVKPPNDKSFPARVYRGSELPEGLLDETPVLVAEIVEWETEFRCFVVDRAVVAFSIYLRSGQLQEDNGYASSESEEQELRDFIQHLLDDSAIDLLDSTVLDLGKIAGRGWAIVEQNSVWGAGIYGCNPDAVLTALERASRKIGPKE